MKATLFNWALSAKEIKLLYEHPILFKLKFVWSNFKRIMNIRIAISVVNYESKESRQNE